MAIDYVEVMGALGSMTTRHPQTTSLAMQTYSLWNNNSDELKKIYSEYSNAAANATGALDKVGILMQNAAMHPKAMQVLIQVLTMWQTRIPDLIQLLQEFETNAAEAQKT